MGSSVFISLGSCVFVCDGARDITLCLKSNRSTVVFILNSLILFFFFNYYFHFTSGKGVGNFLFTFLYSHYWIICSLACWCPCILLWFFSFFLLVKNAPILFYIREELQFLYWIFLLQIPRSVWTTWCARYFSEASRRQLGWFWGCELSS